jgi:hypothetical protein
MEWLVMGAVVCCGVKDRNSSLTCGTIGQVTIRVSSVITSVNDEAKEKSQLANRES